MSKDTGGPAFPVPGWQDDEYFNGMTLRDYFAAKWLQGWIANPSSADAPPATGAKWAYQMADAMIAERNKQ